MALRFIAIFISVSHATNLNTKNAKVVAKYFDYWNKRDMESAISCFDENCVYEDTLYPNKFKGRNEIKSHLFNVANALPRSFQFCIDEISDDVSTGNVGIQWHVESNQKELPFTRGCSLYTVNRLGFISKGFDVPEPTLKSGNISLKLLEIASKLISQPIRNIPLVSWIFYCWLLFFSAVAPGVNALALDAATWQEVKDLSLNFWLVLPTISPANAPVLHPILEGVFNLLLAWAALFIGFITDGRRSFGGQNEMTVTLAGMQLLTIAIYLPYLVSRDDVAEKSPATYASPLSTVERIGESKITATVLGLIGAGAVAWGIYGRADDFGDLSQRFESFRTLLLSDRLTFSFVVDLVYFAIFQGWLVDADAKRRSFSSSLPISAAKYIPFLGLIYYFMSRPALKDASNNIE